MAAIAKNAKKTSRYAIGGVSAAILWSTFDADGVASATYTGTEPAVTGIALDEAVTPAYAEPEDGSGFWSDNTQYGNNRYPKPTFGGRFANISDDFAAIAKALDLTRHTALVRTYAGKYKLLGKRNGLIAEKSEFGSAAGDGFAGVDFTISGAELERAADVPESVWNSLLALCTGADAA